MSTPPHPAALARPLRHRPTATALCCGCLLVCLSGAAFAAEPVLLHAPTTSRARFAAELGSVGLQVRRAKPARSLAALRSQALLAGVRVALLVRPDEREVWLWATLLPGRSRERRMTRGTQESVGALALRVAEVVYAWVQAPEAPDPESTRKAAPDAAAPDIKTPDTKTPDTKAPGTTVPSTTAPGKTASGTTASGDPASGDSASGATAPGKTASGTTASGRPKRRGTSSATTAADGVKPPNADRPRPAALPGAASPASATPAARSSAAAPLPPAAVTRAVAPATWALRVGGAVDASPGGLGFGALARLGVQRTWPGVPRLSLGVLADLPVSEREVVTPAGTTEVSLWSGGVEARWRAAQRGRLSVHADLGGGVVWTVAEGQPRPGFVGQTATALSAVGWGRVALGVRVAGPVSLRLEGEALWATPRPVITNTGVARGTWGQPGVRAAACVEVAL